MALKDSHYQALYVSDYFVAKDIEKRQNKRLFRVTKRALRRITSMLRHLFPMLFRRVT